MPPDDEAEQPVEDLVRANHQSPQTVAESPTLSRNGVKTDLDERIARSDSPEEIVLLTQVRGEILRQDKEVQDTALDRRIRLGDFIVKRGLSIGAFGAGVVFAATGHFLVGMFLMGAALYPTAKEWVMAFARRVTGDKNE